MTVFTLSDPKPAAPQPVKSSQTFLWAGLKHLSMLLTADLHETQGNNPLRWKPFSTISNKENKLWGESQRQKPINALFRLWGTEKETLPLIKNREVILRLSTMTLPKIHLKYICPEAGEASGINISAIIHLQYSYLNPGSSNNREADRVRHDLGDHKVDHKVDHRPQIHKAWGSAPKTRSLDKIKYVEIMQRYLQLLQWLVD